MRLAFASLLPVLAVLVGCAELPLQEAIALDRSLMTAAARKIYLIDAISRAELHVYHTPRNPRWEEYQIYKRVAGKWHVQDRVVGGSIRFP